MSSNRVAQRAYRALLAQTRTLQERGSDTLTLRLPVEGSWGHGQTSTGVQKYQHAVKKYLGDLVQTSQPAFLTGATEPITDSRCSIKLDQLPGTIRERFRSHRGCTPAEAAPHIDNAMQALRVLSEQTHLLDCSAEGVTDGVHVEMTSRFIGQNSGGGNRATDPRYIFTYRARVTNTGSEKVKIIGRSWLIHNATSVYTQVPKGYGVVGCTPILGPGDFFEYHSGTDLDTAAGAMEGSFQMVVLDENLRATRRFDAQVPRFRLIGDGRWQPPLVTEEESSSDVEGWESE